MTHVETIAIHFVGYNLLHGAVRETTSSLALIRDLSASTGRSMSQWNLAVLQSTLAVSEANANYAKVVAASGKVATDAAQVQALAYVRLEEAHVAVTAAIDRQIKAEADLVLIQSRAYTEADRLDMVTAANMRLAAATGDRAIAEKVATAAALELAMADRAAADAANISALREQVAAAQIIVAEEEKTATIRAAAAAQVTAFRTASAAAMGVGAALLIGAGVSVVALGLATSKAGDFRSQMLLLHTQARVSLDQINNELTPAILNMAGAVGFSAIELSNALFYMESEAGGAYTTAHALDLLYAASVGAAVGHAKLDATAKALAATMQVFPEIANGPIGAMGTLDAIVGQGMMTMEDLNGALRTGVLATLKSAGIGLADFGGALATMTDYAIPAIQAANSLRMAIYLMTAPTGASDKVLKGLGLTTKEISSVSSEWTNKLEAMGIRHAKLADDLKKPGGIILAMQDLKSHMETAGLSASAQAEVIYKAFGGGKMGKAVVTLYENIAGGAGASRETLEKLGFTQAEISTLSDRLVTKTIAINAQTKKLADNFALIKAQDPAQVWKMFTSALNSTIIAIGTAFIPILVGILHFITPIVSALGNWIQQHQALAGTIIGVALAVAGIFGSAMIVVGALGMIASAFVAIAAAPEFVFPVAAAFFLALTGMAGIFTGAVGLLSSAWESLAGFWDSRVVPAGGRLWGAIQSVWTMIQSGLAIVQPMFDVAFADFADTLTEHGGLWSDLTLGIQNFSADVVKFIKSPAFAALVADFAVALPAGLKVALDSIIVFGDALQIAFTILSATARLSIAMASMNFVQAGKIIADTAPEIVRLSGKMGDDMNKQAKDASAMLDGTYKKEWQQVYDNMLIMQDKIGKDGALATTVANNKIIVAEQQFGIQMGTIGNYVGASFADGIVDGMVQREQALHNQSERMVNIVRAASHGAGQISSPSRLMAREVGVPMAEGITLGWESEMPEVRRRVAATVMALVDVNTPSPSLTMESPVKKTTGDTSGDKRKTDTAKLEELMSEAVMVLRQIRDDESQINSYSSAKRTG